MHYKQNNKESKSYVQGLRQFGNTLPRGVKGILKKNGYNYSEIINKWKLLVGNDIAHCSYPKSIKMNREKKYGILIIAVQRGSEIEVEYSKKEIINKINSYFGYELIKEIKLQTFNSKIKNTVDKFSDKKNLNIFEKKINEIKNEEIKDSLYKLLNIIKNDKI
tara:strand:- start:21 stop:509 length:489 start_codon:yes stop_codon:yes gene_type:complete